MQSLSPTILRSYLECPRYYYLAFVRKFSFVPTSEEYLDSLLTHQANQFIYHYLPLAINSNSHRMVNEQVCCDFEITANLNQKISQVLDFFMNHLQKDPKYDKSLQFLIV